MPARIIATKTIDSRRVNPLVHATTSSVCTYQWLHGQVAKWTWPKVLYHVRRSVTISINLNRRRLQEIMSCVSELQWHTLRAPGCELWIGIQKSPHHYRIFNIHVRKYLYANKYQQLEYWNDFLFFFQPTMSIKLYNNFCSKWITVQTRSQIYKCIMEE